MADALSQDPERDAAVIWHGRPAVGLRGPDLVAGLCVGALVLVVLWPGLAAQKGWDWGWAGRLAGLYAGVIGATVAAGRATSVGWVVSVCTSFFAAVSVGAVLTAQQGLAQLCPLSGFGGLAWMHYLRYRQRAATRYEVTRDRVRVGEAGRYVIAFPLPEEPRVRHDVFGNSLGEVDFGRLPADLTTRDGRVFKVPAQRRLLRRIAHPERLLEALRGR
jgi:hypothetical protein